MSRLYLIDACSLGAWRHYSVTESSEHSDMAEGIRFWWAAFMEFRPTHAAACFDCSRASNWRKKCFAEYKGARDSKPTDQSLRDALRDLPDVFASLGVPTLLVDGFEGDDLIATLADQHDGEVIIVTTDKDLHQLVDDRVRVYDPKPNKGGVCVLYDVAMVEEKHHVPPGRLRELLAIQGDSADSIPGVKGWGKVAAVTAIKQTRSRIELVRKACDGTLDGIGAAKQKAFADPEQRAAFDLSYELVGLRFDVPIPEGFSTALRNEA